MLKSTVPFSCQVIVPAKFLHPLAGSVGAGERDRRQRPQNIEKVTRVPLIPVVTMGRDTHSRKVFRRLLVFQQIEHQCRNSILAIVVVCFHEWRVIAIRDATFTDIKPQQANTFFNRMIQL